MKRCELVIFIRSGRTLLTYVRLLPKASTRDDRNDRENHGYFGL